MYRSDKKLTEDLFFPFQLLLLALESLGASKGEAMAEKIKEAIASYVSKYRHQDDSIKFIRRCERISREVLLDMADKNKFSGHKFILVLHCVAQDLIEDGYDFQPFVIELFEPFLEIEAQQDHISDDEWILLKKSAEKQAKKLLLKLKTLNYFL